jgi:hypothetical protein
MPTDRPMSEYEAALFTTVTILGRAILKLGASETDILTELRDAQGAAQLDERKQTAATLGLLIRVLCEPPWHYVPR